MIGILHGMLPLQIWLRDMTNNFQNY